MLKFSPFCTLFLVTKWQILYIIRLVKSPSVLNQSKPAKCSLGKVRSTKTATDQKYYMFTNSSPTIHIVLATALLIASYTCTCMVSNDLKTQLTSKKHSLN